MEGVENNSHKMDYILWLLSIKHSFLIPYHLLSIIISFAI